MITARKSVAKAKAYSAPMEGRRDFVRLDFNENTVGIKALRQEYGDVQQYPEYGELLTELAREFNIPQENLLLTNGSSEGLFLSAFCFIEPGEDRALTTSPTFALIPQYLSVAGAYLIQIEDTDELEFDLEGIEKALDQNIKIATFANPNNPTGATIPRDQLLSWSQKYRETLFVVDEAYLDYGGETLMDEAVKRENLIVLRTFSKAWGIAGMRLGMMVGAQRLLEEIRKVKAPYSVNSPAVAAALKLLKRRTEIATLASSVNSLKKELEVEIRRFGYQVILRQGNSFLLGVGPDSQALTDFCRSNGVLVRNQSSSRKISGYIRVTIGTREECWKFINCLEEFRKTSALIFDLDDTLVDTSRSYDQTVLAMVKKYSGKEIERQELMDLRLEGGFNDDWQATTELLKRRGIEVDFDQLTQDAQAYYLNIAKENENLVLNRDMLAQLGKRYRLFILTGRYRSEYEPVWGELDELFERVYCVDDFDKENPKPSGEMLQAIIKANNLQVATYIGNSIDDMAAAAAAGIAGIGIASNMSAEALSQAGANVICTDINELAGVFKS